MNINQAKISTKKVNEEIFSLNPSAIITFFEIDFSDLAFNQGFYPIDEEVLSIKTGKIIYQDGTEEDPTQDGSAGSSGISGGPSPKNPNPNDNLSTIDLTETTEINQEKKRGTNENFTIFRFHNSINLTRSSIFWRGDKYIAAPINAEGFELNSQGTLPTPKLSISTHDSEGIESLAILRFYLQRLNNLVGAKVTRYRVFAKHLDADNFINSIPPEGFDPDPYAEFPRDIFYIDRKSNENKYGIELQLASAFDIEGLQLPSRIVVSNRCLWKYRGCGCLYEYASRKVEKIHGKDSVLPVIAPAVANDKNEKIEDLIQTNIIDKGKWSSNIIYNKGDSVFIEKSGLKYYFVAKENSPLTGPPNLKYWIPDQCSKDLTGCKLRFKEELGYNYLPFGGFPAVAKSI